MSIPAFDSLMGLHGETLDVRRKYAAVFKLLSFDSCLDAIIPLVLCEKALKFVELSELNICSGNTLFSFIALMRHYSSEFAELIRVTSDLSSGTASDVIKLLRHCIDSVIYSVKRVLVFIYMVFPTAWTVTVST